MKLERLCFSRLGFDASADSLDTTFLVHKWCLVGYEYTVGQRDNDPYQNV